MQIGKSYNLGFASNSLFSGNNGANRIGSDIRKKQGGKLTVKKSISASKYMVKVAQAKTASQVAAVIRIAHADMQFVKTCNSDKAEIDKAMRILKQVIGKSRTKIKRLVAEEELEKQEKLARSAKKRKLEAQIREKKNRKQKSRHAKEAADTLTNEEVTLERTTTLEAAQRHTSSGQGAGSDASGADVPVGTDCGSSIEVAL